MSPEPAANREQQARPASPAVISAEPVDTGASLQRGRPELVLLAAFAAAGFSVFVVHALDAALNNQVFLGADGFVARDQLQYLSWATDAGHHGLIANLYAFHLGGHVFLHPLWLLIGVLHVGAGLSYPLLVACLKAATVLVLFAAIHAYARSVLGGTRRAVVVAMVIALFMSSPTYLLANVLQFGGSRLVNLETLSVVWINGYYEIALAVAAMLVFLMQVDALLSAEERSRADRRRRTLIACAAGVTASWLHPWQGLTLLVIVVALVVWERPAPRAAARLLAPVLTTAAPLAYYAVLPRADAGWAQAQQFTSGIWDRYGDVTLLISMLPIFLLVLPGYAGRARSRSDRILRLWPLAIVVVFIAVRQDRFHAIGGFSVPAAILIVRGWPWIRDHLPWAVRPRATWLAAAGICVAVAGAPIVLARRITTFDTGAQAVAELPRDDARALDRIVARHLSGGVLTRGFLGSWVPPVTDHATWTGHPTWTPDYYTRSAQVAALFSGSLDSDPARELAFVRSTGAAIVLEPCGSRAKLDAALRPAGWSGAGLGCATLYWQK